MANAAQKSAQENGAELARKYAAVFVIRDDATYESKVQLGMMFAGQQGLTLENGAAFVQGFVEGISSGGRKSSKNLSLEDKIDLLLSQELDKRLGSGPDTDGGTRLTESK